MVINAHLSIVGSDSMLNLTRVKIESDGPQRIYIFVGTFMMAMSPDQFTDFVQVINEAALPILEVREKTENESKSGDTQSSINITVNENLDMKDSIGG